MSQPATANRPIDTEDTFLTEVLNHYKFWKARAVKQKDLGYNNDRELEYAEAYRVLLHRFSQIEQPE